MTNRKRALDYLCWRVKHKVRQARWDEFDYGSRIGVAFIAAGGRRHGLRAYLPRRPLRFRRMVARLYQATCRFAASRKKRRMRL